MAQTVADLMWKTDLVTLAAQDFAREPVAHIQLPVRVPLGFHGSWIADS